MTRKARHLSTMHSLITRLDQQMNHLQGRWSVLLKRKTKVRNHITRKVTR